MKPHKIKFSIYTEDQNLRVAPPCPYRQGDEYGIFGVGSYKCEGLCNHCLERSIDNMFVVCNFKVLDLSLMHHWYDEIESGRKEVEYRKFNDYWKKRLMKCQNNCTRNVCRTGSCFTPIKYDAVRFHRGQGGKKTMMFECLRITTGKGIARLGATPGEYMFCIYLGKRLQ